MRAHDAACETARHVGAVMLNVCDSASTRCEPMNPAPPVANTLSLNKPSANSVIVSFIGSMPFCSAAQS